MKYKVKKIKSLLSVQKYIPPEIMHYLVQLADEGKIEVLQVVGKILGRNKMVLIYETRPSESNIEKIDVHIAYFFLSFQTSSAEAKKLVECGAKAVIDHVPNYSQITTGVPTSFWEGYAALKSIGFVVVQNHGLNWDMRLTKKDIERSMWHPKNRVSNSTTI